MTDDQAGLCMDSIVSFSYETKDIEICPALAGRTQINTAYDPLLALRAL